MSPARDLRWALRACVCALLACAFTQSLRAAEPAAVAAATSTPAVALRTEVLWLDAPGGAAPVAAHPDVPVRPGQRVRVVTHYRYAGEADLPRHGLVIDAPIPRWLRFTGNARSRRGADVSFSADGYAFAAAGAVRRGDRAVNEDGYAAVRWVLSGSVSKGDEGELSYEAVTR